MWYRPSTFVAAALTLKAPAAWLAAARRLPEALACAALLALCPWPSLATPQFAAPFAAYSTGPGSRWVAAGDLNGSRQVGSLGPGQHALDVAPDGGLRPGIYFLRLTQGVSEVRERAAVVR